MVSAHRHLVGYIFVFVNLDSNEVLFVFSCRSRAQVLQMSMIWTYVALRPNNLFKPMYPREFTTLLLQTTRPSSSILPIPRPPASIFIFSLPPPISSSSSAGEPPSQSNLVHLLHLAIDGGHPVSINAFRRPQLISHRPGNVNLCKRPRFTVPTAKFDFPSLIAVHRAKAHGHATAANTGRTPGLTFALGGSYVKA